MIERTVSFFPDLIECRNAYEELQFLINTLNRIKTNAEISVFELSDDLVLVRDMLRRLELREYPAAISADPEGFDTNDDLPF